MSAPFDRRTKPSATHRWACVLFDHIWRGAALRPRRVLWFPTKQQAGMFGATSGAPNVVFPITAVRGWSR